MSKRLEMLSAGQIAQRSGVAVSALHFYERNGLISAMRSAGNQRRYARAVLRRVAIIRVATELGIPLSAVKTAFDSLPRDRVPTASDWERIASGWRAMLDERITRTVLLRDRLADCIGCGCLSVSACPLANPDDIAAERGTGAVELEP
ncbi:redox-sensitive transcriptional activator SoxR [Inquilinus sp. CAU 1745]|uniref:redox-sensitive transcriptional activator SoxR n=1 Tax=Inquilinus sp. CAU 1745 TaxID=3140369 RepID=UPI00325C1019